MQPIRRGVAALLGGAFLGAAGLLYAREIEPRWLEVRRLSLVLPRLAPEFDGYTVVQLGDIHLDDWAKPRRLTRLTEKVNALRPDLISLTGDFLSYSAGGATPRSLTGALGRLRAPDGCLAVLGNHDYLADAEVVRRCLSEAGVRELANDVRTIRRGGAALHVAGVDDLMEGRSRLDLVLDRLPEAGAAILLAHEPDFADASAATGRFDLQLSGHSHGGQVRVPLLKHLVLPPFSQRYTSGLYEVGGMLQYTNRGLGSVKLRLRFLCRPEITVLTLRSPDAPHARSRPESRTTG